MRLPIAAYQKLLRNFRPLSLRLQRTSAQATCGLTQWNRTHKALHLLHLAHVTGFQQWKSTFQGIQASQAHSSTFQAHFTSNTATTNFCQGANLKNSLPTCLHLLLDLAHHHHLPKGHSFLSSYNAHACHEEQHWRPYGSRSSTRKQTWDPCRNRGRLHSPVACSQNAKHSSDAQLSWWLRI